MEELWNRLLGFMPTRPSITSAVGTFLLIIVSHYLNKWGNKVTDIPWKNKENQRNRQKILRELKKNEQQR